MMGGTGIREKEDHIFVYGSITYDNVVEVMRAGVAAIKAGSKVIDLTEVVQVDSSAVSMLLEWVRTTRLCNREIEFINLPASLTGLIELYDVGNLIPSSYK